MDGAHGVSYPPALLENLPQPASPVRLLPTNAFEQLHLSHIVSHPQDHILFPFLHGLEGENEAQNSFFATAQNAHETHLYTHTSHPRVKVPKYRGLIWVICEEDLEANADVVSLRILRRKNVQAPGSTVPSPSSSMYSSSSESLEEDDEEDDYDMEEDYPQGERADLRVGVAGTDENAMQLSDDTMPMPIVDDQIKEKTLSQDQPHMHPVSHRSNIPPAPIPVPSSVSSTNTSASSGASFSFDNSTSSTSPETDRTSVSSGSPNPEVTLDAHAPGPDSKTQIQPITVPPAAKVTDPAAPPLLTGTFRPKELLRRVKTQDGNFDWEFTSAKVPEGISLRNFGIQVPIYATLSDIVVYSPKGASSGAISLAQRFARAIEVKRQERIRALGFSALPDEEESHGLLKYNVFVLDAAEEAMRKDLSHLMMRICVEPVTGGLFGTRQVTHGAHTDGSDGHVVELAMVESMERKLPDLGVVGDMDMDVDDPSQATQKRHHQGTIAEMIPNTVDFAQREKEEMRDLTKASEIISLFPTTLTNSPVGSPGWNTPEEGTVQQRHRSHSSVSSHHPYRSTRPSHLQFLPQVQPPTLSQPNFTFSPPPGASLDISSTISYFDPQVGQVFLGNSGDVPLAPESPHPSKAEEDPFDYGSTNDPKRAYGYDICIECHDLATFPSAAHLRAAEEHLAMMDLMWADKYERQMQARFDSGEEVDEEDIPPRPPPHANAVIHLTLPSSPSNTQATMSSLMPVIRFLEKWLRPVVPPPCNIIRPVPRAPSPPLAQAQPAGGSSARRWSSVASFMPSFVPFGSGSTSPKSTANTVLPPRNRSFTSPGPAPIPSVLKPKPRTRPTRPLKILIYSSDGYTESSVPALCLLMAIKGLTLPEAYLDLQVAKRRSFFVYSNDLGILRRMEARLREERERSGMPASSHGGSPIPGTRGWAGSGSLRGVGGRPPAKSVSFATPPNLPGFIKSTTVVNPPQPSSSEHLAHQQSQQPSLEEDAGIAPCCSSPEASGMAASVGCLPSQSESLGMVKSRPRANTSPWLPSLFGGDHQSWFNDPRFDGSFPSRVLPFLYLGNLNHASNAYMLHALGITHVVSVGECALVPPATTPTAGGGGYLTSGGYVRPGPAAHFVPGKGPGRHGSLWIEEREGRIKVLDIKGVCDDGIDTLEPQLEPICEWIDKARQEGGQVLVHCRVGVSRSATVTIAYVMKHLNLPLVDAYLIVRSRRLSVLIQPNMRLLYNLCGWEIKLAKLRAGEDEKSLKKELSRTLSWPYLAKEVHALNEKYLH
ncbi:hypothetical protein P691DRAFT_802517 [Macrolepiota fuliginosa MF-IS2]|uniref:Uncharacterized protein n=1 Tax=Macrolepiota fuliginosa MF-IS2 TaxID=1400762 RepID=A0A9P5X9X4_9AGAR|nr:hypothetical protein P691DRAFT_802517 [Macrolepiota fuliginosa MF-IS2]